MSNEINIEELEQSAGAVKGWRCDCSWTDMSDGVPISVVGTIDEEGNKHPVVFVDDNQCLCGDSGSLADFYAIANPNAILSLIDRLKKAEAELERERMRLAACGVVAMADTPESAARAREMRDEYRSASCDDVARRVDECMTLRAERDALAADLANQRARALSECDRCPHDIDNQKLLEERDALGALVSDLDESSSYWSEYEVPLGIVERIKEAAKTWKGRKQ